MMGMTENAREIEDTIYRCLKANGMKISPDEVYIDYQDFAVLKIRADTDDGIGFVFGLSDTHVVSTDGKYSFEVEPFKKPLKPLGE